MPHPCHNGGAHVGSAINGSHWSTKPDAQRLTAQPSALLSAVLKTPRQRLPSRPYLHAVVTNHNMALLLRRMWAIWVTFSNSNRIPFLLSGSTHFIPTLFLDF